MSRAAPAQRLAVVAAVVAALQPLSKLANKMDPAV